LDKRDYAVSIGLKVKVNIVIQKGVNDQEILPLVEHFKEKNIIVRFIEFMDVGNDNGWNFDKVVTKKEMLKIISSAYDVEPVDANYFGEVATYYRHKDNGAQFGLIMSVSASFCSSCTRTRISSDGKFYGCLFAEKNGYDIKSELRSGKTDEELLSTLKYLWNIRDDRYSDERTAATVA
ncbi:GTP 3',8-cyclase MoaA, partial [Salmonella sp. 3DZ2-4SM]